MKLILPVFMMLALFPTFGYATERKGENMSNFEKDIKLENWKELWSDGSELLLIRLPGYIAEKKIYEIKDRRGSDLTIGRYALSPDSTKVAFVADIPIGKDRTNTLYIFNIETGDLKKIGHSPSPLAVINLRGFLGDNRLLLEGYVKIEDDQLLYSDKAPDNSHYFYIYDFNTRRLEVLNDLGLTTVGMANSKCAGDSLTYDTGDGFVVYNVNTKNISKINKEGDLVSISPDGQKILFKDIDNYYLVDKNGQNQELILTKKEINKFIPLDIKLRGGYWELRFWSWSPDGRYILFNESSDQNKGKKYILDVGIKELEVIK